MEAFGRKRRNIDDEENGGIRMVRGAREKATASIPYSLPGANTIKINLVLNKSVFVISS